jgi:hypothetical protein
VKLSELIFVGIAGSVVALNRLTGQQVWATHLKGTQFVNVVLQDGKILATTSGEAFCLDGVAGKLLWHNPLKGYGRGLASMASLHQPGGTSVALSAEKRRQDEQAAAAAAAASAAA